MAEILCGPLESSVESPSHSYVPVPVLKEKNKQIGFCIQKLLLREMVMHPESMSLQLPKFMAGGH